MDNIIFFKNMMAGGIIQIVSYGNQDLFLTGNPHFTYFKIVYRRHTIFAIETIQQDFIGDANFGTEVSAIIDKLGDLMHRIYLEITIPEVNLEKKKEFQSNSNDLSLLETFYLSLVHYLNVDIQIIKELLEMVSVNHFSLQKILDMIAKNSPQLERAKEELFISFENLDKEYIFTPQIIVDVKVTDIIGLFASIVQEAESFENQEEKNRFIKVHTQKLINQELYERLYRFFTSVYDVYLNEKKIQKERYSFAWVEELGHAIIDYLELRIGSQLIDRHTGDWLIARHTLYQNEYQEPNFRKMIGDVPELILFNDHVKPSYHLIVPLQFWFCRYNGCALPLIALHYHEILLTLRMRPLGKVCYFSNIEPFSVQQMQAMYNLNLLNVKLWVDYVLLDRDERKRFAQSTHEYLIEVVQFDEYPSITGKQYVAFVKLFNPVKYIIWFFQPNAYRFNPDGTNKCQWNNYATHPDKNGRSVEYQYIFLNTMNITDISGTDMFFNYIQPYYYFRHSPRDGLFVYSFSFYPMDQQPSGTCNFSRLTSATIVATLTDEMVKYIPNDIENGIYMGIYALSYNILRIAGGMAGLAFTYVEQE
jgi:hypothetical protein